MKVATIVASLEAAVGLDGSPRDLQLAIETVLIERHQLPVIQAAESADRLREKVAESIAQREAEVSRAGGSPVLRIVGSTGGIVTGFCYALPDETPEVIALRFRRAHAQAIFNRIRLLTFQEFELFGARVLCELGAKIGRVTAHSNDQGIDFYGEFNLGQLHLAPESFLVLARDVRLLFAGQAKHYPDRSIGPTVIRELIGALTLARTKTHSTDGIDIFKDLSMRPFSPVVALIFTTGEFSSGATRLADAAGVIAKTGLQLAVFLADRGVGIIEQDGALVFSEQKFNDWLKSSI